MSFCPLPSLALLIAFVFPIFFPLVSAASIKLRNTSPESICYGVESRFGTVVPTNAFCGTIMPGILVPAHTNVTLSLAPDFSGAFTDFRNWTRGSRHEMNYKNGKTWYNVDYEMGISNSTFGPLDGRNTTDNFLSLAGEVDALAKANAAWVLTDMKPHLVDHYWYLVQHEPYSPTSTANLTGLRMDKNAPYDVRWFLQMEANLTGYCYHGSVDDQVMQANELTTFEGAKARLGGVKEMGELTKKADGFVWKVETLDMVITAY